MKKEIFRAAFVRSIPILCSYIFVSMAYGIMMQNAGFPWFAFPFRKPDRIYRGLPVCADYLLKQRASLLTRCADGIPDEQPSDLLQSDFPEGISSDGEVEALYDSHDDG